MSNIHSMSLFRRQTSTHLLAVAASVLGLSSWHALRAEAHGYLAKPVARNAYFLLLNEGPEEYCTQCKNSGGAGLVAQLDGKHGICGDPYEASFNDGGEGLGGANYDFGPYDLEIFSPDVTYEAGGVLNTVVQITAHHKGFFEFYLCVRDDKATEPLTQACLEEYKLELLSLQPGSKPTGETRYYLDAKDIFYYDTNWRIPEGISCTNCVLQWHWVTSNSCVPSGYEVNSWVWNYQEMAVFPDCIECNGGTAICNGEEFWNCADIRITNGGVSPGPSPPPSPPPPPSQATAPPPPPPTASPPSGTSPPLPQGCGALQTETWSGGFRLDITALDTANVGVAGTVVSIQFDAPIPGITFPSMWNVEVDQAASDFGTGLLVLTMVYNAADLGFTASLPDPQPQVASFGLSSCGTPPAVASSPPPPPPPPPLPTPSSSPPPPAGSPAACGTTSFSTWATGFQFDLASMPSDLAVTGTTIELSFGVDLTGLNIASLWNAALVEASTSRAQGLLSFVLIYDTDYFGFTTQMGSPPAAAPALSVNNLPCV